jgi:hypothetical protein
MYPQLNSAFRQNQVEETASSFLSLFKYRFPRNLRDQIIAVPQNAAFSLADRQLDRCMEHTQQRQVTGSPIKKVVKFSAGSLCAIHRLIFPPLCEIWALRDDNPNAGGYDGTEKILAS